MSQQMATSLSDTAYLNLSQARPSLLKRVLGPLSRGPIGRLDGLTPGGLDESTSRICTMNGYFTLVRGMRGPVSMTPDLDKPCLGFLLP